MSQRNLRNALRTRIGLIVAGTLIWTACTMALGTLVIHTDQSLRGILGFHIDGGYAFVGATLIGFILGVTFERPSVLVPLTLLCCAGGAAMYAALLFTPVWTGVLIQTTGLENFASTRALLYFGLAIIPLSMGAVAGRLLGTLIPGGDLLAEPRGAYSERWWLDRKSVEDKSADSRTT